MKFLSLQPFIPSGPDFENAKQLFLELGFAVRWDAGDYVGFDSEGCRFILQRYDNKEFAENLMISVQVSDAEAFHKMVQEKGLPQRFGIRLSAPTMQPYGKEVNLIDKAGVCWHFVES